MSGAAASLSCCRSSAPTQIARNWRFNNGFQGQCNHGTRSIVAILKLPDVPGQPHARRTVGIAAFDLKSIKVDAGVRADTCYAAFRPRRCNPRRGAFTSAPLRFKQGAKATSSSPVRASLCHHQILGPSSSLPSKRLQRCKFPGGKQLHHCPIKLGKGAKLNKALSTRAIFDFDWSDSPRGWAERASTFLPPLAPDPVKFQRKRLDLKFAVLLMRSSYEAVDELDFVPMDRFQVKFWKLRQSELEPYALQYSPLKAKYGDLTDPLYFDFISFSQYAAISNEMREGQQVFQEKLGAGGLVKTVRRNPELRDNASLPSAFQESVAKKIYTGLVEGFEEVQFGGPVPCDAGAPADCLINGVKQILSIFVKAGYALKATVSGVDQLENGNRRIQVRVEGPANLWSVRSLASRRASVYNEFIALAVLGFLLTSGVPSTFASKYSDTGIDYDILCITKRT